MRRLPIAAFGALAVATVAAVFITQHLKVTTPFIAGETYDKTPHWIVPTNPKCDSVTLYFHLLHSADSFNLEIVDSHGRAVRTLVHDVHGQIKQPFQYSWNGRLDDGSAAPVGLYNFQLHLIHQDRTIDPEADFPISVQSACHM